MSNSNDTNEISKLQEAIISGDAETAYALTEEALSQNVDAQELVSQNMIPAMDEVGRRFEANEFFVPELLIAARAMKRCMEIIRPILAKAGQEPVGRVVIGTVKGDLHDIGKNLVASMLEGGGFEVADLGVNVTPEDFVAAIQEKGANIVGLSALLTTTMPAMKEVIDTLKTAGVRDKVKIIVGGAPVTTQYAEEIDADAYGETAVEAVAKARELSGKVA